MKLSKVINPKFKDLLRKLVQVEMPIKTAIKLKRISQVVDKSLKDYEEARIAAIVKYADRDENGEIKSDGENNAAFASDEVKMEFANELTLLLEKEVELDSILLEDLGDKFSLSVVELMVLEDIISTN